MNKTLKIFFVFAFVLLLTSCNKDDDNKTEPLRDYSEQYTKDLDSIQKYMETHFMTVDDDKNVTFTKITTATPGTPIKNRADLDSIMVNNEDQGVNYKVYFIKLRQGSGRAPSEVDSVHVAYRGSLLTDVQFDSAENPVWEELETFVQGWREILPKFNTGIYDTTEGPNSGPNPVNFQNYGAGVMFIPSGLGYFGNSTPNGTIPTYSPLIFSFKLMELRYKDHDRDGILSKDEGDPNNPTKKLIDYDSDGDGRANMYDVDDDGDHVLTKNELKKPDGTYYTFETVPGCDGLATNPNRVRRYLDPSCH